MKLPYFILILFLFSSVSALSVVHSNTDATFTSYTGNLTNLSELEDVNIPTPANGEVLTFHGASALWIAQALPSSISWAAATNGTLFTTALWNTNYTANNANWNNRTNLSYYLSTNPFGFYNITTAPIYINDTFSGNLSNFTTVYNYALNSTGITWANAVNGTLFTTNLWNTNYTTNNDAWLNTTNLTYSAYNSSGLIQNWNATGYIRNWNTTGDIADWNSTGYIKNWTVDIYAGNSSLYNWIISQGYATDAVTWVNVTNGTVFLQSEWDTNYTTNNDDWLNRTNLSYVPYTGAINNVDLGLYNLTTKGTGFFATIVASLNGTFGVDLSVGQNLFVAANSYFGGDIFPTTTLNSDIGSGAKRWAVLYIQNISSDYINNAYDINTANLNASGNITATGYFLGNGSQLTDITVVETDPFWNSNWTNFSTVYGYALNGSDLWNANYSTFLTHIDWSDVINGTVFLQSEWDTNYTANNDVWLNTTNLTYAAFNSSGLIRDWNSTGYIKNWNSTGLIANWSLAALIETDPYWTANYSLYNSTWNNRTNLSYYLSTNPFGFYNITTAPIYINDTFYGNYTNFLTHITWATALNGTLFTQAEFDTNYTANDAAYRNTTNITYSAYNSSGLIRDWNSTGLIANWSASETDPLSLHLNQDNFYHDDWIIYDGATYNFTFNESKLATIYYNATSATLIRGTIDGTIDLTQHPDGAYDSITLNITEAAGSPGLDVRVNFTDGIESFSQGIMRYYTNSLSGSYPIIQLWDYDDGTWTDYPYLVESLSFRVIEQSVFNSDRYVQDGTVQMRLYKAANGNTNNHYYIDWLAIAKGYGTPAGEEVDPYSIHRDGSIPLTANWNQSAFNLTSTTSWFLGLINSSSIQNPIWITWANAINGTLFTQAEFDTNYTANDAAYRLDTDTFQGNYTNFTTVYNYALNSSGISWANALNGTLFTQSEFDTNYTANDVAYRNTTNLTYDAFNSSGLIRNWNSSGLIANWSVDTSGFLIEELDPVWDSEKTNYYNKTEVTANITSANTSMANYVNSLNHDGITWANAVNGTLFTQAEFDTNYTANDAVYRNTTNYSYVLKSGDTMSGDLNMSDNNILLGDNQSISFETNVKIGTDSAIAGNGFLYLENLNDVSQTTGIFSKDGLQIGANAGSDLGGDWSPYMTFEDTGDINIETPSGNNVSIAGGNFKVNNGNITATSGYFIGDGRFLTNLPSSVETLWNGNYSTFLTHITWANVVNGTLFTQAEFDTNYTANDAAYRLDTDTFKANYSTYLTKPTWAIAMNGTLFRLTDWQTNYTANNANWLLDTDTWAGNFTNYFTSANVITYINANDTTVNNSMKAYVDATFVELDGDTMSGILNMSDHNITAVDCIVFNSGGQICSS